MVDNPSKIMDKVISAALKADHVENTIANRITYLSRYKAYVTTGRSLYFLKDDQLTKTIDKMIDDLLDQMLAEDSERKNHGSWPR